MVKMPHQDAEFAIKLQKMNYDVSLVHHKKLQHDYRIQCRELFVF
jgi:hypothetical protein